MKKPLSIKEYVENKTMRFTLSYRYHGFLGRGYYLGENVLAHEEIQTKYPVENVAIIKLGEKYKGENPDGTHVR